jgi:AcrR family transcriptional regulator
MVNTARARRAPEATEGARVRILQAALELFSAKGFDGTGLRELATAAAVNHSLVLYYFGSMDGVWKAVVGELVGEFRRQMGQRLAGLSAIDPVTRLKVMIESFIRFSMEHPEFHRIMTHGARRRTERLKWVADDVLKPTFRETAAIIERGQAEGTIRAFDPALLYYALLGLGATPMAFALEIEAVTGRKTRNEATVLELMSMISTLMFTGESTKTPPKAKARTPKKEKR